MNENNDILRSRAYDGVVFYTPRQGHMSDLTQARIHREKVREHLALCGIARLEDPEFVPEG